MGFLGMVGAAAACVGVWVFASSVSFFRGAARLAAYVLVTPVGASCGMLIMQQMHGDGATVMVACRLQFCCLLLGPAISL